VLTALPSGCRKVAVSFLVLFHFGGTLVNVTLPRSAPWMSKVIWTIVYRPYMEALYLTGSHHYFSLGRSEMSQVWFCVKYDKDSKGLSSQRWFKFPRRPDDLVDPMGVSYWRRLEITGELADTDSVNVTEAMKRRRLASAEGDEGIPINKELSLESQYRVPSAGVREFMLPSCVQYIANLKMLRHPEGIPIKSIRVYLVEHSILTQNALESGFSPYDPVTYQPYFFGEFDTSGKLLDSADPLLYWLIPIIRVPNPGTKLWQTFKTNPEKFKLIDGVKRHNGDFSVQKKR
jgi:hypothetical protein